jgi:hypothetical protein
VTQRFEEGLQEASHEPEAEVLDKNVGKLATGLGFKVKFEAGRGVRVVHGAALEKRSPHLAERGFESHPLRLP